MVAYKATTIMKEISSGLENGFSSGLQPLWRVRIPPLATLFFLLAQYTTLLMEGLKLKMYMVSSMAIYTSCIYQPFSFYFWGKQNALIGIVEPSLIFFKRKINPFCVMFVDRIPDKIYSTKSGNLSITSGDYCSITTSDGNKFICKGSYYSILRKIEAGMDTSGMPFWRSNTTLLLFVKSRLHSQIIHI